MRKVDFKIFAWVLVMFFALSTLSGRSSQGSSAQSSSHRNRSTVPITCS